MSNTRLIGETESNTITVPLDRLGAPGVEGRLVVEAQFRDDRYLGVDRQGDSSARNFYIRARLVRSIGPATDVQGDIKPEHGGSFLRAEAGKSHLEVESGIGILRLDLNNSGEVAMASTTINRTSPAIARADFIQMLSSFLDRISYQNWIPAAVDLVNVRDLKNEVQYIHFRSPPRAFTVLDGGETLFEEMRPVYALYREAQNAVSPYYRVLCLYKIVEGLLGSLASALNKRARAAGIKLDLVKVLVPDHPDIVSGLRSWVGKPMKDFYDRFLSKEYRDVIAHFELRNRNPLNVSSAADASRYADVAFISDLCVRKLIERHENALRKVADVTR